MGLFSEATLQAEKEAQDKRAKGDFGDKPKNLYKMDFYLASVQSVEVVEQDEKKWSNGVGIPTGKKVERMKTTFNILKASDGTDPRGEDGTAPTFNTLSVWFNQHSRGSSKDGPGALRQFLMATIDGIEEETEVTLNHTSPSLSEFIENKSFIGKELKVLVDVYTKKDGNRANKIPKFAIK